MTTNPFPFQVLFCFEDEFKLIVEIKRTDLQSEDKSLVYKWLMIQKQNEKQNEHEGIQVLTFQSMNQADGEQTREFAEGTLSWNAGTVIFHDDEMDRVDPEHINPRWLKLISQFLD
ncbi:hypothetical protein [Fluviicola taffensis]|uniref:hypothetical protein n=1 Tax=Fluviicola taffensis TaxID=191579 RepID=UPI0031378D01